MFKLNVINECSCCLEQPYLFDSILTLSTWVLMRGAREEHDESVHTQISVWDGRVYVCVVRLLNILTWWTWFTKFSTQVLMRRN